MKKKLEKISWLTRKWNLKFNFLSFILHDEQESWGFRFLSIKNNFKTYSLLSFVFRLPNKTTIYRFIVDEWDFLYLYDYLYKKYERLDDIRIWGKHNKIENIIYKILEKIV